MFCANCGQSVEDGEKFCFHCGKAVVKRETIIPNSNDINPEMEPASFEASKVQVEKILHVNSTQIKQTQTSSGPTPILWFMIIFMATSAFTIFLPWLNLSSSLNSSMGSASASMNASPGMVYGWVFIFSIGAAIATYFQKKIFIFIGICAAIANLITGIGFISFWKDDYIKASGEFGESFANFETSIEPGFGVIVLIVLSSIYILLAITYLISADSPSENENIRETSEKPKKNDEKISDSSIAKYNISKILAIVFSILLVLAGIIFFIIYNHSNNTNDYNIVSMDKVAMAIERYPGKIIREVEAVKYNENIFSDSNLAGRFTHLQETTIINTSNAKHIQAYDSLLDAKHREIINDHLDLLDAIKVIIKYFDDSKTISTPEINEAIKNYIKLSPNYQPFINDLKLNKDIFTSINNALLNDKTLKYAREQIGILNRTK